MLLGFIAAWEIKPKNQIFYRVFSILIPLIMLVIVAYIFGQGIGYRTGQVVAECTISTICTMIMMLLIFYLRPKKKKV